MSRTKSPNVWIKGQGTEEYLHQILAIWKRDRPNHYAEFRTIVETEMSSLLNPNGMSAGGNFAIRGHIPTDVYLVVERQYPGFFTDPHNMFLIHRMILGDLDPSLQKSRKFHYIERKSTDEAPPVSSAACGQTVSA